MFNEEIKRFIPDYLDYCKTIDGRYKLLNKLGKGRYGKVYLAYDLVMDKLVALKSLRTSNVRANMHNFVSEITTLARLSLLSVSLNVTKILDFNLLGIDEYKNPVIYYTMEFVELGELFVVLEEIEHISEKLACYFFRQLCESLIMVHNLKILHLDLKPENVLMDQFGGLILCDFGNSAFLGFRKKDTFFKGLKESKCQRISEKGQKLTANEVANLNSNDQNSLIPASKTNKIINLNSVSTQLTNFGEKTFSPDPNEIEGQPVELTKDEFFEFLRKSKFLGTSEYASPEISELEILKEQLKGQNKTNVNSQSLPDLTKLDVFSLGVLLFVIVMKSLPFGKAHLLDAYYKKFMENREGFWKIFSKIRPITKEFKEIVQDMLELGNKNRATLQSLRNHRWVIKNFPNEEQTKRLISQLKNKLRQGHFADEKFDYGNNIKTKVEECEPRQEIINQASPKTQTNDSINFDQRNQNKLMFEELENIINIRKSNILIDLQTRLDKKRQKGKTSCNKISRPYLKEVSHTIKEFVEQNRLKLEKLSKIINGESLTETFSSFGFSGSDENSSSFSGENLSVNDSHL